MQLIKTSLFFITRYENDVNIYSEIYGEIFKTVQTIGQSFGGFSRKLVIFILVWYSIFRKNKNKNRQKTKRGLFDFQILTIKNFRQKNK